MRFGVGILIVHLIIVALFLLLSYFKILKVNKEMFAIVLFVPVFGALCALLIHITIVTGKSGSNSKNLEAMRGNEIDHTRMPVPEAESNMVVPLEDALIMDDASIKRSVIMDVLMADTKSYSHILNQARMNEDVEVVHYATTAMVELSKEYELKLQEYSIKYAEDPSNVNLLTEYITYLGQFLESDMAQGQVLEIQRNNYQQLLVRKISLAPTFEDYASLSNSYLNAEQYSSADATLKQMEKIYDMREELWILKFRYYYQTKASKSIKELIDKTMNTDQFISSRIMEMINFWENSNKQSAEME